ncbi:MAG: hypothetical protein U0230_23425 [Polyangiales bacterium]
MRRARHQEASGFHRSEEGARAGRAPRLGLVLGVIVAGCSSDPGGAHEPPGVDASVATDAALDASGPDGGNDSAPCRQSLGFDLLQFGSPDDDLAVAVGLSDDCGVYVAGTTRGKLEEGPGSGAAGDNDLFLRRIGRGASDSFLVQLGSHASEIVSGLAVSAEGDAVVVGSTQGELPGGGGAIGLDDAFAVRFTATGERRWSTQYGTLASDFALDVLFLPDGDLLVGGTSGESPLSGYDIALDQLAGSDGRRLVGQRRGTEEVDRAEGLALAPDGTLVVVGATQGSLAAPHQGSFDAFVSGFEWLGASPGFALQRGTDDIDAALDVAVDADGAVYVALASFADLAHGTSENDGLQSPFVAKLDRRGSLVWIRRIAPAELSARAMALALDPSGGVFVAGSIVGSFHGDSAGGRDALVWRLDGTGEVTNVTRLGSLGDDEARDVVVTAAREVVVVGSTAGALVDGQRSGGGLDAFVARLGVSAFP